MDPGTWTCCTHWLLEAPAFLGHVTSKMETGGRRRGRSSVGCPYDHVHEPRRCDSVLDEDIAHFGGEASCLRLSQKWTLAFSFRRLISMLLYYTSHFKMYAPQSTELGANTRPAEDWYAQARPYYRVVTCRVDQQHRRDGNTNNAILSALHGTSSTSISMT